MYKVIREFKDKDGKIYKVGDAYKSADKARLKVLSTGSNKYNKPFIELVKKPIENKAVKEEE